MEYTLLILILPLLSFTVLGLVDSKWKPQVAGTVGTAVLTTVAILSYYTAYVYFTTANISGEYQKIIAFQTEWVRFTEHLHIDLGILLDPISVMMLVVISTVSLMVHIYSLSYMHGEKGFEPAAQQAVRTWLEKDGSLTRDFALNDEQASTSHTLAIGASITPSSFSTCPQSRAL